MSIDSFFPELMPEGFQHISCPPVIAAALGKRHVRKVKIAVLRANFAASTWNLA
jgi:hypothetical protein